MLWGIRLITKETIWTIFSLTDTHTHTHSSCFTRTAATTYRCQQNLWTLRFQVNCFHFQNRDCELCLFYACWLIRALLVSNVYWDDWLRTKARYPVLVIQYLRLFTEPLSCLSNWFIVFMVFYFFLVQSLINNQSVHFFFFLKKDHLFLSVITVVFLIFLKSTLKEEIKINALIWNL